MSDRVPYDIPPGGSLGLLAAGWRGVQAWREVRGSLAAPPSAEAPVADLSGVSLVVVTGLPRSGTSMVMQMLAAAGVPPYTDGARDADASNPRGYLEAERVTRLAYDASWLAEADGHALKVVAPLVPHLPAGPTYRAVLIERDLDEVLRSQEAMLDRQGATAGSRASLRVAYARYLDAARVWLDARAATLVLRHRDVIDAPLQAARALHDHLGVEADPAATAATVDPSLYRQRAADG